MDDVILDTSDGTLTVPHIGFTMRTLLAVAARGHAETGRRSWNIRYKHVVIGSVRVKSIVTE